MWFDAIIWYDVKANITLNLVIAFRDLQTFQVERGVLVYEVLSRITSM